MTSALQGLLHDRRALAEASLSVASFMENSSGCSALHCMLSIDDMHKFGSGTCVWFASFCGAMVLISTALTIFTCAMFHTDNASAFFICNHLSVNRSGLVLQHTCVTSMSFLSRRA